MPFGGEPLTRISRKILGHWSRILPQILNPDPGRCELTGSGFPGVRKVRAKLASSRLSNYGSGRPRMQRSDSGRVSGFRHVDSGPVHRSDSVELFRTPFNRPPVLSTTSPMPAVSGVLWRCLLLRLDGETRSQGGLQVLEGNRIFSDLVAGSLISELLHFGVSAVVVYSSYSLIRRPSSVVS